VGATLHSGGIMLEGLDAHTGTTEWYFQEKSYKSWKNLGQILCIGGNVLNVKTQFNQKPSPIMIQVDVPVIVKKSKNPTMNVLNDKNQFCNHGFG
jgi:hypothetical protein